MKHHNDQKTQDRLFAFNRVKNLTFLPSKERAVLGFYAENYNWADNEGSHWSQEKICELLGIRSEKTLRSLNKNLEELNWISIEKKYSSTTSDHRSSFVQIHIGDDDPQTLEKHRQKLISQIEKDTESTEQEKQRASDFIKQHGRHETELQDLLSAQENFRNHHPDIYSREIFLRSKEKDFKNEIEITY